MKINEQEGFLVLTIYLPRRRWYGKLKSHYTLEARVPSGEGMEISWDLASSWMPAQWAYSQYRIPTEIHQILE